jgi:polyphosphate kinase
LKTTKNTIVRDLSWLAFNGRVLQEAQDPTVPLPDRIRFLGIFSNNLDEFFRVRVATLERMVRIGKTAKMHLEVNPEKIRKQIQVKVAEQQAEFDKIWADVVGQLAKENIHIKTEKQLSREQKAFVAKYFDERVRTQLVPLMVESMPTTPLLSDKRLYLACVLGNKENAMLQRYSLIEVPTTVLPRFVILPAEAGHHDIILLEDIIRFSLPTLFAPFGFNKFMSAIIKLTRDAELDTDQDVNTNLIEELEKGLKARKKGRATRFIYDRAIDPALLEYLTRRLGLTGKDNLIAGGRIHNFKDFMDFPRSVFERESDRPQPFVHPLLVQPKRVMEVLDKRDVMLHLPYHSFDSVLDLLREAAIDPFVQSIKIACYRLAKDSKVINALINAVRNGKQVTAVLELRARFDEEANLMWKTRLEEEGVNVVHGPPDMKVHAKICTIKKREFNRTKYYAFVSTGNVNESTARFYGDHLLMTSNMGVVNDCNRIFAAIEDPEHKWSKLSSNRTLPTAPLDMRRIFLNILAREIRAAKKGKKASVILKMNSLSDKDLILKIYEAAHAGVSVKLIVRGICCAYTEQKSFKKPIRAISIVDEYLEHARVFVFENGGKKQVFISSADWMVRNLDHRIEAACPIRDESIQQELTDILNIQLSENVKGRLLDNEQTNRYITRNEKEPQILSQEKIYKYLQSKTYTI